jgi:hypothetical protein
MAFSVKVLKDSIGPNGVRLTTMEITQPRAIHPEFLTHRVFSRNAASSRAIPIQKMISRVWNDPFVPVWFGKNQSGMSANEELAGVRYFLAKILWLLLGKFACVSAWLLWKIGLHKQISNRVLEPWSWITVIVTGTEWSNFFALRTHPDAQPEIRHIALLMEDAYKNSKPKNLLEDQWHLPLVDDHKKLFDEGYSIDDIVKISVGRCARVSYLTHDGKRDPKADIQLANRLMESGHWSPFEHVAQATVSQSWSGNIKGFVQYRKTKLFENDFSLKLNNTK